MIGLSGARLVLLDDESAEALPKLNKSFEIQESQSEQSIVSPLQHETKTLLRTLELVRTCF